MLNAFRFCLLSSLVICCGCNPEWPEHAGTAEVHGEVTLDGFPVGQAKVVFVPVNLRSTGDKIMPIAYGETDAEGGFRLQYSDKRKELIAGTYTVIISRVKQAKEEDAVESVERKSSPITENEKPYRFWIKNSLPWASRKYEPVLPDAVFGFSTFTENGETIPSIFNRNSILNYEIRASPEVVRPKFELKSIDPALEDMTLEDLPLE